MLAWKIGIDQRPQLAEERVRALPADLGAGELGDERRRRPQTSCEVVRQRRDA